MDNKATIDEVQQALIDDLLTYHRKLVFANRSEDAVQHVVVIEALTRSLATLIDVQS